MGWIGWVALLVELATVVTVDKQAQGKCQCLRASRKTARGSGQTRQVVAQLGVIPLHRVGIGFAIRNFVATEVIPQVVIGFEGIAVILHRFRCIVYQFLEVWLRPFPDHFPTQKAARLPVYEGEEVDPVFLLPIKVKSSSISAVLTSLGTGASGRRAALALTHKETVRWCRPR
jgi:hypothetical protein